MIDWGKYPKNKIIPIEDSLFLVRVSDTLLEPKHEKTIQFSHLELSFFYNDSEFTGYILSLIPVKPKILKVATYMLFCSETDEPAIDFDLVHLDGFSLVRIFQNSDVLFVLL